MKNKVKILRLCITLLLIFIFQNLPQHLKAFENWNTDFYRAVKQAQKSKKAIFVHFYTPWCPYCTKMQQETFNHPKVQKILKSYVKVKVNVARDQAIAQNFGIRGVPDNRVYKSDGTTMLMRLAGYVEGLPFAAELAKTLKYIQKTKKLKQEYSTAKKLKRKKSLAILLANQYYKIEKYDKAVQYYGKSIHPTTLSYKSPDVHKKFGFSLMAQKEYKKAINQYEKYLRLADQKNNKELSIAKFFLAYSQLKAGRLKSAFKNFSFVIENSPDKEIQKEALYLRNRSQYQKKQ